MYDKVNDKETEQRQNDVTRPIYSVIFIVTLILLSIAYAYLAIGIDQRQRGLRPGHESNKRSNVVSNSNLPSNELSNSNSNELSNSNSNEPSNSNSNEPSNSNSNVPKPSNSNSNSNSNPTPPPSNSNSNPIPPTPIEKPEWKIIFDNVVVGNGSVEPITYPTIDGRKTSVSYEVALDVPGEYFTFNVDMVNKGEIDAKIYDIIEQGLTNRQKQYLDYKVKYQNGNTISTGDTLLAGQRKTVTIWLKFKDDIEKEDLPDTDQTLSLKYQVLYVEK